MRKYIEEEDEDDEDIEEKKVVERKIVERKKEEKEVVGAEDKASKEKMREELGFDPDKLLETLTKFLELYSRVILLQLPLGDDLKEAMKELFEKQYPGIKPYKHIWHVNWVFEALEAVANSLSIELVNFFEKVKKDENFKEGYDNYERYVRLYAKPYEAHKMEVDYCQLKFDEEQIKIYEQILEEEYQEDLISFKELNRLKNEFLNLVAELVVTYFDIPVEDLTPDQLLHYNVITGLWYEEYLEACKELNYYFVEKKMQDFPGLNYFEFLLEECKSFQSKTTEV